MKQKKEIFEHVKPEQAKQVLRLYRFLADTEYYCTWTEDYPTEREVSYDLSRDALFCLKDEETGEMLGVISMDDDAEVEAMDCWSEELKPSKELSRIAVFPEYQNQGVARKLISCAMEKLKNQGYRGIHLLVAKSNEKALRSYQKLEFTTVGECEMFGCKFWCYEKKL